jgi:hypothetical protein
MPVELTYKYGKMRFWEMLPGMLVWGTFIFAITLSFIAPFWAIVFIIIFDLLWLFRVVYFVFYLYVAWKKYRIAKNTDWQARVAEISKADRIHHLIFLPTYKEGIDIIRTTLQSIKDAPFPSERMMIVLAGEGRDEENFRAIAKELQEEFAGVFKEIFVSVHPVGLPDEIPGKGSNLNWTGKLVAKELKEKYPELKDQDIIATSFDVDTIAHEQYFSNLTYLYCTVENPTRASYQPVTILANNIWTSTAPVRVSSFGTTFWILGELVRPERLWTFSSHSMPWTMLKDVGFWQKDIVSEDSRIFMQAFVHYHGAYRVEPIFLPVSMDTVVGDGYWAALKALFVQQRRWAWGVEHTPYIIEAFIKDKKIPSAKKRKYLFNHFEGMFTWATAPILIFILGWLPLSLAQEEASALVQAAPFTLELLMQLAMVGIFASAILSLLLLPPRPKSVKKHTWIVMLLQWILLPITFIVFGSFPAVDAQTRLMLGKYLGFHVTKKKR